MIYIFLPREVAHNVKHGGIPVDESLVDQVGPAGAHFTDPQAYVTVGVEVAQGLLLDFIVEVAVGVIFPGQKYPRRIRHPIQVLKPREVVVNVNVEGGLRREHRVTSGNQRQQDKFHTWKGKQWVWGLRGMEGIR